jgi:hypothetical protein
VAELSDGVAVAQVLEQRCGFNTLDIQADSNDLRPVFSHRFKVIVIRGVPGIAGVVVGQEPSIEDAALNPTVGIYP